MKIECCFTEDNKNIILQLNDNGKILIKSQCEQNFLCEKLPSMFNDIVEFIKTKQNHDTDLQIEILFDKDKHITTYRILKSFELGFNITK